jgi:hypothetical protein
MTKLDMKYVAATSRPITASEFTEVTRSLVIPPPSVTVMQAAGFDLSGFDVNDAYGYREAVHAFFQDLASAEYRAAFHPDSLYIHPCQPKGDPEELAASLRQHGLAVTLVKGVHEVPSSSGFILTGSKIDLSAHLASAYLLAGYVPPQEVLLRGLEKNATGDLDVLYQQAAAQTISHFSEYVDRLEQFVDPDFSSAMTP